MPKYSVVTRAIVSVKAWPFEADTPEDAAMTAADKVDFHAILNRSGFEINRTGGTPPEIEVAYVEYTEENDAYIVDQVDDDGKLVDQNAEYTWIWENAFSDGPADNDRRVHRVEEILARFGADPMDPRSNAVDLLTDLMHWFDAHDQDGFEQALWMARDHHEEETAND